MSCVFCSFFRCRGEEGAFDDDGFDAQAGREGAVVVCSLFGAVIDVAGAGDEGDNVDGAVDAGGEFLAQKLSEFVQADAAFVVDERRGEAVGEEVPLAAVDAVDESADAAAVVDFGGWFESGEDYLRGAGAGAFRMSGGASGVGF